MRDFSIVLVTENYEHPELRKWEWEGDSPLTQVSDEILDLFLSESPWKLEVIGHDNFRDVTIVRRSDL